MGLVTFHHCPQQTNNQIIRREECTRFYLNILGGVLKVPVLVSTCKSKFQQYLIIKQFRQETGVKNSHFKRSHYGWNGRLWLRSVTCLIDEKLLRSTTLFIIKFVMEINTSSNGSNSMFCQWCLPGKVPQAMSREHKSGPSGSRTFISAQIHCRRDSRRCWRGSPGQETDITCALLSITGRWWHIKYSREEWRQRGRSRRRGQVSIELWTFSAKSIRERYSSKWLSSHLARTI